jgi:cell division protein FtsB
VAIKIPKSRKKVSLKSQLVWAATGLAALAVIAFLAISNWRLFRDSRALNDQVSKLQEQIQILEERRATLKAGINAAQGEAFQEEKMREQGYKKPGEEVIAVLQDEQSDATKQNEATASGNFWLNLWEQIKNIKP